MALSFEPKAYTISWSPHIEMTKRSRLFDEKLGIGNKRMTARAALL
jgi:hypothetical protein